MPPITWSSSTGAATVEDENAGHVSPVAEQQPLEVAILVDPYYSTGNLIAKEFHKRGCAVMALWSKGCVDQKLQDSYFLASLQEQDSLSSTKEAVLSALQNDDEDE